MWLPRETVEHYIFTSNLRSTKNIMSCKMKIDTFTAADAPEAFEVHLMPCKIDYNGEAPVRQYFNPVVKPKSADCSDGKKR